MANDFYQYWKTLSSEKETSEEESSAEESSDLYVNEESSEKCAKEKSSDECVKDEYLVTEETTEKHLECIRKFIVSLRLKDLVNEDIAVFQFYVREMQEIKQMYGIETTEIIDNVLSMIKLISDGHKRSFRGFSGLDFNEPRNRCAYLLRYAACHTGLVRKAMWNIFQMDLFFVDRLKSKDELNIVSLGGGPGNDILGFCGALEEFSNCVTSFDFTIVDIKDGWSSVLDSLIRKTKCREFESLSFSKILKNLRISSNFILADLTDERISDNENLTNALNAADVVLMVKLTSFHSTKETSKIIMNVCEAMRNGCILVFIDCPYPRECFQSISCVRKIYEEKMKYRFDSSPRSLSGILNIKRSQATVAVFVKV